jgi:hypothetical protein
MNEIDNVAYFRKWADDIRISEGPSVDADKIEAAANELEAARERILVTEQALREIARQHKSTEWEQEGDTEHGYDAIIDVARAALGVRG